MMRLTLNLSAVTLGFAIAAAAAYGEPGRQELIGARVYAADGPEVGRVADVLSTGEEIDALRVSRDTPLGLGERFVIIPRPAFMIRRGRIILPDLRSDDVDQFPDASSTEKGETVER